MSGLDRLGAVSRDYQERADAYRDIATASARAEAAHKTARAKVILRIKSDAERMSMAEAEVRAEADDTIAELFQDRLIKAALLDAAREKLRQLKEQIAYGRTYVATEREIDRMHAEGRGGAA